jgi:hypothetical protein
MKKIKIAAVAALMSSIFTVSASENVNRPLFPEFELPEIVEPAQDQVLYVAMPEEPEVDKASVIAENLTEFAATFLGRRYVWGATGPKNFDCSGFTSYVFRNQGIELPRTSRMQYTQGEKVDRSDLKAGDLMFFSSPRSGKGTVGHVGIVVSVDEETNAVTFIHASTKKGITYQKFPDGGYYSRNYIGAKRVIENG